MTEVMNAPLVLLACSGPGAAHTIAVNTLVGGAAFVGALAVVGLFAFIPRLRGGQRWVIYTLLALALVHPGWWMSARGGDCGFMLRDSSLVMTGLILAVALLAFWRHGHAVRKATRPEADSESTDRTGT